MTGFAKDDHGSLQTSQASISLLGKPEEYKIHKAKVRKILSWTMREQKMLDELRGRRVRVFHQHACLFLPDVLTPRYREAFSIGCLWDPAEIQPAGAPASLGPRSKDAASESLGCATAMTTAGATRPGPQCLWLSAAQPTPLSPAPPDPARPSSAHLPGAPRPGHLLSPGLCPPGRVPRPRPRRLLSGPVDRTGLVFWPPRSGPWRPPQTRTRRPRAARILPPPSLHLAMAGCYFPISSLCFL